jgi:hypothetical protein
MLTGRPWSDCAHTCPPSLQGWRGRPRGLESGSGLFLHEVTAQVLGATWPAAVISGPSFAGEVAQGLPTAVTVAAREVEHARRVATALHGSSLRAYTSTDVIGVELGGAIKNVLAIAAGIADGLGFGANARAALITRGLAEMVRLGLAVGGQRETFMGLTGVGDLVLTCTDDQSRNRRFGLAIGRGEPGRDGAGGDWSGGRRRGDCAGSLAPGSPAPGGNADHRAGRSGAASWSESPAGGGNSAGAGLEAGNALTDVQHSMPPK